MTTSDSRPDSVRLALPREAGDIAALQRRSWAEQFGSSVLGDLELEDMTKVWEAAISRPPLATYRVLVALQEDRVVGFAATVPSDDPDAEPGADGMIVEFDIDPLARSRGHGSRLLNACVDTLRADRFRRATWWVRAQDDTLRTFLADAGWAVDGSHREIGSEDGAVRMKQVRLHTDITDA